MVKIGYNFINMEESSSNNQRRQRAWLGLIWFSLAVGLFWLLQYWYQYYIYEPGNFAGAWIRSHALAVTTLIAGALFSSIVFKFVPSLAGQWVWRRRLGVAGASMIVLHVSGVLQYGYAFDLSMLFFSLNPYLNPVLFGLTVYPILIAMLITSSDWMVRKLKKWWKVIHRFVYLAEIGIVFHVVLIGGPVMKTAPGYLLYILGGLVIIGQIYWWFRISRLRKFRNVGFYIGLGLILLLGFLYYLI